jgi:hypothetical protein
LSLGAKRGIGSWTAGDRCDISRGLVYFETFRYVGSAIDPWPWSGRQDD